MEAWFAWGLNTLMSHSFVNHVAAKSSTHSANMRCVARQARAVRREHAEDFVGDHAVAQVIRVHPVVVNEPRRVVVRRKQINE